MMYARTWKPRSVAIALLALLFFCAPNLRAQEEGAFDPREAVKKISEGFDTILESLSEMSAENAAVNGEDVVENIDDLLNSMKGAQSDVVKNIDDLIRNQKLEKSNSSPSSGSSKGQQKPNPSGKQQGKQDGGKQRDRNQKEQ